jgi:hypothetical protein
MTKIEKHRPIRCYKCDAPIFIKPLAVDWDRKIKQIPYCFYSGQLHYCANLDLDTKSQQQLQQQLQKQELT